MTGSKPKPSCKLLSLLTSRASLGSANFPPIEIELRTPRRRRRHTHLWEPRIIAAAGNRGHLWGEQHGIETRTKRNHSRVNSGRLTIGGNYSRSPIAFYGSFRGQKAKSSIANRVTPIADKGGFWLAMVCPLMTRGRRPHMTQLRHWLCTAATVLMPVSAP